MTQEVSKLSSARNVAIGVAAAAFLAVTLPLATIILSLLGIIGALAFAKGRRSDDSQPPSVKEAGETSTSPAAPAPSAAASRDVATTEPQGAATSTQPPSPPTAAGTSTPASASTAEKTAQAPSSTTPPPPAAAVANGVEAVGQQVGNNKGDEGFSTPPSAGAGMCKPAAASQLPVEPTPPPATAAPTTGGAAILARLRQQRAARESAEGSDQKGEANAVKRVTVVYASQTGTCQEIARNIHAQAQEKGFKAQLSSFNELGFPNLTPTNTPILILVASSTGDGDPPDNSAKVWVQLRKRQPPTLLSGMQYTVLGLGDSNYTRFMHVPRVFRTRFSDLGADCFFQCEEADEVDGIEEKVEAWVDNLWAPLKLAVEGKAAAVPPVAGSVLPSRPDSATSTVVSSAADGSVASGDGVVETAVVAAAAAPAPATAGAAAAAGQEAAAVVELVDGLAPEGVDLKGVPALPAPRMKLVFEPDAERVKAVVDAEAAVPSEAQLAYRDAEGWYSAADPYWAEIVGARYMTADWSDRKVLHVEVGIEGSGMRYGPGDAIGVLPRNSEGMVGALLERLGLEGTKVFSVTAQDGTPAPSLAPHLGWPCTLHHALSLGVDITTPPRKSLLRMLAEYTTDPAEKRTLLFLTARAGRGAYNTEISEKSPTLLDLLNRFRSCQPPVDVLLDSLPPLAPRMYSLTSAPEAFPDQAQVALSVVSFQTEYGTREGVASTWLDRLCQPLLTTGPSAPKPATPIRIPIYLRKGGDFKPPETPDKPLVMVGPGTGVAPFRGFLQSRQAALQTWDGPVGESWLFFGCRRSDEDFLYREDLEAFAANGTLTRLLVAFSREGAEKVYVQHLMKKEGARLAELLLGGAYVYVCGDGAGMAKDVHAAIGDILVEHGGVGREEVAGVMQGWAKSGRYVRDIWS